MKLIVMMPVRNEQWCLGLSLRVALMWCDAVVVADHGSTDGSRDIMNEIADQEKGRVIIRDDREYEWREMEQRQMMLETAREAGATHLAICDADEIWSGNLLASFEDGLPYGTELSHREVSEAPPNSILELPGYNLRHGINHYHANGVWGNRWFSTAFQDAPDLGWSGDRFHHREPGPRKLTPYRPIQQGQGGVMHLWGASERRLIAKHALYKVTERLRFPYKPIVDIDHMYSLAIRYISISSNPSTWNYNPVPESWWAPYAHLMKYLDVDAEPWQEAEVRRLVAEHGREKFTGLDLFGVA